MVAPMLLGLVLLSLYLSSTPELMFAVQARDAGRTEALLARGADVNATTVNRSTALHFAAMLGDVGISVVLLRHGAKVDSRNRQGETPLMLAVLSGNPKVVALLLDHGADPNARTNNGLTALHAAAYQTTYEIAELLIARGAITDTATDRGVRPLHLAAQEGSTAVIQTLLAHGAAVDAAMTDKSTALHIAASNGNLDAMKMLVQHKATLEARDADGLTPLLAASLWRKPEAVALLRKLGADGKATDDRGRSARDLVRADRRSGLATIVDRIAVTTPAESPSGRAIFVERIAWLLAVVWFPIWTRRRRRRAQNNRTGQLTCYAGTVAICLGAMLLLAVVHGVVSHFLQVPTNPDVNAARSLVAVAAGGFLALSIAKENNRPVEKATIQAEEPQVAVVAAAAAAGTTVSHRPPGEPWSCPHCGIINTAGSEKCDCGCAGADPAEWFIGGAVPSPPRPWHRLFARAIDGFIAGVTLALLEITFVPGISNWVLWNSFLTPSVGLLVWIPLEAACLAGWGTTPGKWLFHVQVLDRSGSRLSFETAIRRAWMVLLKGVGFGIFIVAVITQAVAYRRLTTRGITSWDEQYGAVVTHGEIGGGRALGIAAAIIFVLIATVSSRYQ